MEVNEKQLRNLTILNTGKFNFDYQWELHMSNKKKEMVTIEPLSGGVKHGDRVNCKLTFCPPCRTTLKDTEIVLKVNVRGNSVFINVRHRNCPQNQIRVNPVLKKE